jgi:aryl-alcohol dehydrogenase-like predicted oxidoreductase
MPRFELFSEEGHMIPKQPFGATGHTSSRAIFGSFALSRATQAEADAILETLSHCGINHLDTAPRYGDAELRIGPWMRRHRKDFFLATKTDQTTYQAAKEQFDRSLERLQVDRVDLLQFHNLTDVVAREIVMGPGGALEFLVEAKEKGLTRFIGITGHGSLAPKMHLETLGRYPFDSVLLPCNYLLMRNEDYANRFHRLVDHCRDRRIAVQTIKSIARGYWGDKTRTHTTWYEPLSDPEAISKSVHWMLAIPDVFLITVGDKTELPKVLDAVAAFRNRPTEREMDEIVRKSGMAPLFV